jgi:hypothetical protein
MPGNDITLDPRIVATARALGLDKALAEFPACIADAARAVANDLADMPAIEPTAEPWPPMQMRASR